GAAGGRDALWLDYEHDGDVDFVVASDSGLALWVNRGDGRFEPAAPGTGLNGSGRSLAAADLDGNGAVDLIVARGELTQVHENQRAGVFRDMPTPPGPWAPADRVLVNDLDNDGRPDAALIAADRTQFQLGGFGLGGEILHPGFAVTAATFTDYDNDGWLDLVLAGSVTAETARAQVRVWRNEAGPGYRRSWRDVSSELGIADAVIASPREALSIDCDNDGDSDLLFLSADGRFTLLRNDSGHANRQLKVRLSNLALANHGGIGATVAVRAGRTVIHRIVSAELPLEIGVGRLGAIDSVQVVWPDGTVDNLIDPPAGAGLATVQRASMIITGSCPYLFAWDGERFRFVTDFLGSGALGLALTRDVTWPPDPVELVRIGDATEFRPRDGRYLINLTSELREVDYFDALELVAVDHPAGTEVHPTDSFMPPPVTPSELWTVSEPIPLRAARDTRGHDVTAPLGEIDGIYALPGDVLPPPLHGVCRPHRCTLDFGELPAGAPLTIAVTGLLEFGTANTNIALSQTDTASLVWPTLEVETADGTWQTVAVNLGIPDGRTKTIVADLTGKLPAGSRRLRLTTSFEIHWDRVALFRRRELPGPHRHTRPFSFAELRWRGFSRQSRAVDGHTRVAHYDDVQPQPPWHTTLEGWCTRYGDALELVTAVDGKLAILNGGDELQLACPADAFPPVPAGCTRTFFLSAVGWDKEENNNTVHGATIEPLPGQPAAAASTDDLAQTDEWMRRYNTRWVPRHRFAPDASASLH
ncbi:MAG TPA: CRTAC1 family protein, partial [Opitutus sp.]|nr:CRTAC1 family protein [Opitutus sp.]